MGREALDAAANAIATRAALAAVVVAAVVILPAVLAGILDHLGRARRLAHTLHRISPPIARRIAALVIAAAAVISSAGRAAAAPSPGPSSVREWLDGSTTTRVGPSAPAGTWYPDPAEPIGDSGPHGTVSLDDLDARTTTTSSSSSTARPTPLTRPRPVRRTARSTTTTIPTTTPPPYAPAPAAVPEVIRYTVVPGDCLWTIAAHRLAPTASAAEVDRAWRAIYDANRDVIGSDPNLILPGQILDLPPLPTSA